MKLTSVTILATAATLALPHSLEAAGCGGPTKVARASYDQASIAETAAAAGNFDTLLAAVGAAGLTETLDSGGPFTVFAPTDEAFARLPEGAVEALLADKERLRQVLTYHVVDGRLKARHVAKRDEIPTLAGQAVEIRRTGGEVMVGSARVVQANVKASNGIIHVIDGVLLPEEPGRDLVELAAATPQLSTLVTAVKAAGLVEALSAEGPYTVLAPTDEAFARLPAGALQGLLDDPDALRQVLLLHVIPGKLVASEVASAAEATSLQGETLRVMTSGAGVTVGGARVIATDVMASNGVVHLIDRVILPGSSRSSM